MSDLLNRLELTRKTARENGLLLRCERDEYNCRSVVLVYEDAHSLEERFLVGAFAANDRDVVHMARCIRVDHWVEWQIEMVAEARQGMSHDFKQFLAERGLSIQRSGGKGKYITFTVADLSKYITVLVVQLERQQMCDMGQEGIETHIMASIAFGAPVGVG